MKMRVYIYIYIYAQFYKNTIILSIAQEKTLSKHPPTTLENSKLNITHHKANELLSDLI